MSDAPTISTPRYTTAFHLTPSSLVSTAAADFAKHAKNREIASVNWSSAKLERPRMERLGFYPADVRGAKEISQIIERAIRRCRRANTAELHHRQKNRRLIYDLPKLLAALQIVQTRSENGGSSGGGK